MNVKSRIPDGHSLPADIYIPLVDSLYQEGRTLLVGSIFVVGSVLATYFHTGEPSLLVLAVLLTAVATVRGVLMKSYQHCRSSVKTTEQARQWELSYSTGAAVTVGLLGAWCFLSFWRTMDPFAHLVSFSMTIAYVIGIFGRNFGSPRFVIVQIACAWVPMTAALMLPGDVFYTLFALLLVPFFLAVWFISERLRKTLLGTIIAKRDISALAMRFDRALTNMPHGLCMFDQTGQVAVANGKLNQFFELPEDLDLKGMSARQLARTAIRTGKLNLRQVRRVWRSFADNHENDDGEELVLEIRNGRTLAITFEFLGDGGVVAVVQDISERRQAERTISRMARFDALTNLPNRNLLQDRLHYFSSNSRAGTPSAVHFIDLDHFKQVNDTLGHSRGDMLLRIVAERLQGIVRQSDMASRFGGDEFVVLQTPASSVADVSALAKRIVTELSKPYRVDGNEVIIGATIGVAMMPRDGVSADEILKNADTALYRAKAENRGTWRFFKPQMEVEAQARRTLELDLRKAVEQDQFELYFQPVFDLSTHRVSVCEALIRWPHPERGFISPGEFIPIAEETGAIVEIGEQVLEKACRECLKWPRDIGVAVNLSPLQFTRIDVVDLIRRALTSTQLSAHRLEIEITESTLLQNTKATTLALQKIQSLGVKVSLDDFGTGHSSLSYLHSFPLNKIKIDRSFLEGISVQKRAVILLRGVTKLSVDLGLRVTVEGIETEDQLELVNKDGYVHEAQGYLFSRPLPAADVRELLFSSTPAANVKQIA